jgi:hypothetical protein
MQSINQPEQSLPEAYHVFTISWRFLSLEVILKCAFICVFEKDIVSVILFEASIEAYNAPTRVTRCVLYSFEGVHLVGIMYFGFSASVGFENECVGETVTLILIYLYGLRRIKLCFEVKPGQETYQRISGRTS